MTKKQSKAPGETVVQAWTSLLRAHTCALTKVERSLKAADFPPLAWYDVLLELKRADAQGLRPFELQHKLLLPQYQLSRLLERIETAGYIQRQAIEEDGRGQLLLITKAGLKIRQQMWQVYGAAIQHAVAAHLTAKEAATLASLLQKLVD